MRLYHVRCRGMQTSLANQVAHGNAFVVADNATEAYIKVRKHLDTHDIGFAGDREMQSVELVADDQDYPPCCIRLYL